MSKTVVVEYATVGDLLEVCDTLGVRIDSLKKRKLCYTLLLSRDGLQKKGEAEDLSEAFHRALEQMKFLNEVQQPCS